MSAPTTHPHWAVLVELGTGGRIERIHAQAKTILGYSIAELCGQQALQFVHPGDAPGLDPLVGWTHPRIFRVRDPTGCWHPVRGYVVARPEAGQPGSTLVVLEAASAAPLVERQVYLLEEAVRSIATAEPPDLGIQEVLELVAEALPCDQIAAFLYDATRDAYTLFRHYGLSENALGFLVRAAFPVGQPFGGRVTRGEILVVNDVAEQPFLPPALCEYFGIAVYVAVPIRAYERHFGALIAARNSAACPFAQQEAQTLRSLGRQIAIAVEMREAMESQRRQADSAQVLANIARESLSIFSHPSPLDRFCELTCNEIECDFSHLWLWHDGEQRFEVVGGFGDSREERLVMEAMWLHPPLALEWRQTLAERGHILLPEASIQALSFFPPLSAEPAAPRYVAALRRGSEIIGFQSSGYRNARVFEPHRLQLLNGVAQLASLVVEHVVALRELDQASRTKSEFVAAMSHEIRTPLNVILGYTDLLLDGAFGPLNEEQDHTLRRVRLRGRELFDLLSNTLDFNRIESGTLLPRLQEVDLHAVVHAVLHELKDQHEAKGLSLTTEMPAQPLRWVTDPDKLRVILRNLVGNAVKFTEQGGVRVQVTVRDRYLTIRVSDTGIGIAPEHIHEIFEPYRQVGGDHYSTAGVGLGLFIVRRLVEMLGGHITVESRPGEGSTFTVVLPSGSS
ncbi:MAG: hypothetical protein KatS3mg077_0638 [Candidatus Binatia bacterium]|nr:MAG: hypothetical protein KatS3mg077_0638 [Candidatus Binatia bacterium]